MGTVFDFIHAALPCVTVGLLLAVFFAGSAKNKKEKADDYGAEGMCLGMCLGTAIGTAIDNNTGIGIALGMLIGLSIGTCIKKKERKNAGDEK